MPRGRPDSRISMRPAMKQALLALTLIATATLAAAAGPGDAEQLRCLGIGDNAARLACYDAAAIAIRDAKPRSAPDGAPATTTTAATAPAAAAVQDFGRPAKAAAEPEKLESHIPGQFSGWRNGGTIRLANGQIWKVVDEGSSVRPLTDPKVTIRPGFLGSYFMTIEGLSFQVKVKRVQ